MSPADRRNDYVERNRTEHNAEPCRQRCASDKWRKDAEAESDKQQEEEDVARALGQRRAAAFAEIQDSDRHWPHKKSESDQNPRSVFVARMSHGGLTRIR